MDDAKQPSTPSVRGALAALSLTTLLSSLATSIANVALPTLAQAFAASFQQVQWVVLAYLLAVTALVVGAGRLADATGRRRAMLFGTALFVLASFVCGSAPWLWLLIVGRAAQGLGAAVMMALAMALVSETVSKAKTGTAMGVLGTLSALGTALGPTLGGLLISELGWRAIFLLNVPFATLALFLAYRYLPLDRPTAGAGRASFDAAGTTLLSIALVAYALAMTLGRGSFGWINGAVLLIAAFAFAAFLAAEGRAPSPLIPLAMVRDPALAAGLVANLLVMAVLMATLVVGPFYLSRALGLDATRVGLAMSAGPLVVALAGVPAGRLADRFGGSPMIVTGLVGVMAGCVLLFLIPARFGVPGYLGPLAVLTGGYALFQTANNTAVMANVAPDQRGVTSGMLSLSRNLGLITGASVMGAVFALSSGTSEITAARPESIANGMRITFAVGAIVTALALAVTAGARAAAGRALFGPCPFSGRRS